MLVLAGLVALGYWGMKNEWTLSHGAAKKEGANEDGWCAAHNVPEDICVECKPDLLPRGEEHGFCRKHGVHECPWCHPEVAQLDAPYPASAADLAAAKAALDFAPRTVNGRNDVLHKRRIQFASIDAYERAGIEVSPAFQGKIAETSARTWRNHARSGTRCTRFEPGVGLGV